MEGFLDAVITVMPWGRFGIVVGTGRGQGWIEQMAPTQSLNAVWQEAEDEAKAEAGAGGCILFFLYDESERVGGEEVVLGQTQRMGPAVGMLWRLMAVQSIGDCWMVGDDGEVGHALVCIGDAGDASEMLRTLYREIGDEDNANEAGNG